MEITLSKRKTIFIILSILLLLVGGGYYAWTKGLLDQWLNPTQALAVPAPNEPALAALSAIYAPNAQAGQAAWEKQVCADMTADGCQLFESMYAPAIWDAARAGRLPAVSFNFVGVVEKLQDGQEVWKLSSSKALAPAVYTMVARDTATHKWMLVRILLDQEVKARYGG